MRVRIPLKTTNFSLFSAVSEDGSELEFCTLSNRSCWCQLSTFYLLLIHTSTKIPHMNLLLIQNHGIVQCLIGVVFFLIQFRLQLLAETINSNPKCYKITFLLLFHELKQEDMHLQSIKNTLKPHFIISFYSAQHSTAQHSTAQHSTAQHSTAQHSQALLSPRCGSNHLKHITTALPP